MPDDDQNAPSNVRPLARSGPAMTPERERTPLGIADINVLRALRKSALANEALAGRSGEAAVVLAAVRANAELAYWAGMALLHRGLGCDDPYNSTTEPPAAKAQ